MNLLFVCTQNRWRSLTAEHIFANRPDWTVRSAGTASNARRVISGKDVTWADVLFAMEPKHAEIIKKKFVLQLHKKRVICLDIPDEYQYMDPELIEMLEASMKEYF